MIKYKSNKNLFLKILFSFTLCLSLVLGVAFSLNSNSVNADETITGEDFSVALAVRVPDEMHPDGGIRYKVRIGREKFESTLMSGEDIKDGVETGVLVTSKKIADSLTGGLVRANAKGAENGVYDLDTTYLWKLILGGETEYYESIFAVYDIPDGMGGVKLAVRPYVKTPSGNVVYKTQAGVASMADVIENDKSSEHYEEYREQYLKFSVNYYNKAETLIGEGSKKFYGDKIDAAEYSAPAETGYTFIGWKNKAGTVDFEFGTTVITGNANIYAKYTANTYTITFNANGGSGTTGNISATYGVSYTLNNGFTRNGYTFVGWATSASGAKVYDDGQSVSNLTATNDATVQLFAKWTANTYNVTLNTNGATSCAPLTSYTYGVGATLPTPIKTGYTFGGWYTNSTFTGSAVTNISTTDTGDKTFYAKWTANTYSVKFNANNGSGSMSDLSMTYDQSKSLTANAFTRTGYTFSGWATSASGSKVYNDGQSVSNLTSTNGATFNLYAKWTANTYSVKFNANGGSGSMSDLSMTYGKSKSLTANAFTRTGYTFAGWATSASGAKAYDDGQSVKNLTSTNGATFNLYAKWTANTNTAYQVKHYQQNVNNNNYTLVKTENLTGTTGSAVTATQQSYAHFNYNSSSSTSSGTIAGDGSLVLNMYYDRETYTVSFTSNSKITQFTGAGTYKYGATIDVRARLKVGYDYLEWYINGGFVGGGMYVEDGNIKVAYLTFDTTEEDVQAYMSSSMTFSVVAFPCTTTEYTVNYYYMNTSGSYPLVGSPTYTETKKGITDTVVSFTPDEVEGFTYNASKSTPSGTITGNGSLVLKIYYARKQYNVALGRETADGTVTGGGNKYYGSSATVTATPNDTYAFDGWYEGLELVSMNASYTFTVEGARTLNAKWKFIGIGGEIGRLSSVGVWNYSEAYGDLFSAGEYGAIIEAELTQTATTNDTQFIYLSVGKDGTVMSSSAVGEGHFVIQIIVPGGSNNMYMTVYDHNYSPMGETDMFIGTLTNGVPFALKLSVVLTNNGKWYLIAENSLGAYIDDLYFNTQVGGSFLNASNKLNMGITNAGSSKVSVAILSAAPQVTLYEIIPEGSIGGVMKNGTYATEWSYAGINGSLYQTGNYGAFFEFGVKLNKLPANHKYIYVSFGPDANVMQPDAAAGFGHFMLKIMINVDEAYPRMFVTLVKNDLTELLSDVSLGAIATDAYTKFTFGFVQGGNGIWYLAFDYNGQRLLDGIAAGDNIFNDNIGEFFRTGNGTNVALINPKDSGVDFVLFETQNQNKQYSAIPSDVVGGIGSGNTETQWSYYDDKGSLYHAGAYGVEYEFGLKLESGSYNNKKIYLSFGPDGTVMTESTTASQGHFLVELDISSGNSIKMKLMSHTRATLFENVVFGTIETNGYYRFKLGFAQGSDDGWYLMLENEWFITEDGKYFNQSIGGAFIDANGNTNVAIRMGIDVPADIVLFNIRPVNVKFTVNKGDEGKFGGTVNKQTNTYQGVNFAAVTSFANAAELTAFENMVVNADGSVNNSAQDTAIKRSVYYQTKILRDGVYEYIDSYTVAVAQKAQGTTTTKPHTIVYLEVAENVISAGIRVQIIRNDGISSASAKILPESLTGTNIAIEGTAVYFTVNQYGSYTLILDDSYEKPVTVFVRKPELVVVPAGYSVIKYSPTQVSIKPADSDDYQVVTDGSKGTLLTTGMWEIGTELLSYGQYKGIGNKTIVYIEKGTILVPRAGDTFGALIGAGNRDTTDIKVLGHGMIDMSRLNKTEDQAIVAIYFGTTTNVEINGVTILNSPTWTVDVENCENVLVEDVIIFGYRVNSDGICMIGTSNAVIKNCFARSGDDLFEVKSSAREVKHILYENCVAWADKCRGFGIIQETMRDIRDVTYKNCTLLYQLYAWYGRSEPDESVPITDTYMAGMVVVAGESASVYDVTFDNCEIHSCFAYAIHISVGQNAETWTMEKDGTQVSPENFQNKAQNIVFRNCRIFNLTSEDYTPCLYESQNPKYFRYYNNTADPGAITVTFDGFKVNDSVIVSKDIMRAYTVYHANANEGIYDYITVK